MHRNMQPAYAVRGTGPGTLSQAAPRPRHWRTLLLSEGEDPPTPQRIKALRFPMAAAERGSGWEEKPKLAEAPAWMWGRCGGPGFLGPLVWVSVCAHFSGDCLRVWANPSCTSF